VVMYAMGHGLHHQSAPRIAAPEDRWRPAAYPCYPVVSTDIDRRPDDGKCYTSWRGMAPRFRGYSAGYKPYYAYLKDGQGYNIFRSLGKIVAHFPLRRPSGAPHSNRYATMKPKRLSPRRRSVVRLVDNPFPSVDTILAHTCQLHERIPEGAHNSVQEALRDALVAFIAEPSPRTIRRLLALPKCILRRDFGVDEINIRAKAFLGGADVQTLLHAPRPRLFHIPKRQGVPAYSPLDHRALVQRAREDEDLRQRVVDLVGERKCRRALRCLLSPGMLSGAQQGVFKKLVEIQPQSSSEPKNQISHKGSGQGEGCDSHDLPASQPFHHAADTPIATAANDEFPGPFPGTTLKVSWGQRQERLVRVQKLLRSFPRGSSAGPSGLSPDHLRELATDRNLAGLRLLDALGEFISHCHKRNLVPEAILPLCGANLTPLPKPGNGVRPIACGETLRRLVAKAHVTSTAVRDAIVWMQPLQVGVGTSRATETVAMGLQELVSLRNDANDKGWAILQVDMKNAFNGMSRTAVRHEIENHAPSVTEWFQNCYKKESRLFCRGVRHKWFHSFGGLQQGDPLGPFLFALTLHPVVVASDTMLKEVALKSKSVTWSAWYLDDGHLFGPIDALAAAFEIIVQKANELGIEVNTAKSFLWGPALQMTDEDPPCIPPEVPEASALRKVALVPYKTGITVLGIPVVAKPKEKASVLVSQLTKRAAALKDDLEVVAALLNPEGHTTECPVHDAGEEILARCFGPHRVLHLLRGADCEHYEDELAAINEVLSRYRKGPPIDLAVLQRVQRRKAFEDYNKRDFPNPLRKVDSLPRPRALLETAKLPEPPRVQQPSTVPDDKKERTIDHDLPCQVPTLPPHQNRAAERIDPSDPFETAVTRLGGINDNSGTIGTDAHRTGVTGNGLVPEPLAQSCVPLDPPENRLISPPQKAITEDNPDVSRSGPFEAPSFLPDAVAPLPPHELPTESSEASPLVNREEDWRCVVCVQPLTATAERG